jgi:hypothetical protein
LIQDFINCPRVLPPDLNTHSRSSPMKVWAHLIWLSAILGWDTAASTAWSQGWLSPAPTYYRVTASLSHAGEQIDFDVVVRCDWKEVGGSGTPRRGRATRTPYVYGQRTKENHAVILQPPNGCLLTERVAPEFRPQVPDDLMPLVLWGDDADDLKLLVAYVSEAGYTHPLSKLTFHKASMTQENAEDYAAWMRIAKPNLITKMNDPFTEWRANNVRSGRSGCYGARLLPLPNDQKEAVRRLWPEQRATFWRPDHEAALESIQKATQNAFLRAGGKLASLIGDGYGLPRPSGGGALSGADGPRAVYRFVPIVREAGAPFLRRNLELSSLQEVKVVTSDFANTGLMYCYEIKREPGKLKLRSANQNTRHLNTLSAL